VCLSAAAGLALRATVRPGLARALLALGIGSLACALGIVALIFFSHGRTLGVWSGGMLVLALLVLAALVLPFALAVSWGRLSGR
jgi:hypothetical protein